MSAAIAVPPDVAIPDRARQKAKPAVILPFPPVAPPPAAPNRDPAPGDLSAQAAGRGLRLTRRGRVVALAVAVVCLGAGLWLAHLSAAAAAPPRQHAVPRIVTVSGRDTLWSIAARIAPDRDPRVVVAELERRNHLPDATIQAGQQLLTR